MQHFLSAQFTVEWEVKLQLKPWRVDSQTSQCLQTRSHSSSLILASNTWKVFVMEDILGQEGSEDCGQEPLWPPAWMFTSKDKKPTSPTCSQPSWTQLHAEFTQYLGLGHKRPLPRLCLTQEPQTTAAIGWWCQQELSQHCAGCALCCMQYIWGMPFYPHILLYPPSYERALGCLPCCSNIASLSWIKLQSKLC